MEKYRTMSTINKGQNVCFILTHVPNPRINKRIRVFKDIMPVEVICARRASQNIWEPEYKDIKHTILNIDLPRSSQIFKRIKASSGFRRELYRLLKEKKPTIVYSEGLDTLMVAVKYKKTNHCRLIFEVSDLRENFIEKPKGLIKRGMTFAISIKEKSLFKSIDKLVVTSPKFYDLHYCDLIAKENTIFVPNAPDLSVFKNFRHKQGGKFTVGFIGGIRYLKQMEMLVDVASELNINVLFAGAGGTSDEYMKIQEYCEGKSNIRFTGRYDYGKDIANLYGMVDCVYSVYDADNPNVKIALPNKLYEAVYCNLPIIVAKGTYLEEIVSEWGVGLSIGHTNNNELKDAIMILKDNENIYKNISDACDKKKSDIVQMREVNLFEKLMGNDENGWK